jgi:methylmalonyl-CoA mutase
MSANSAHSPLNLDEFPANSYAEWRTAAEESLKGAPFEKKLLTKLHEGITLQPIYNAEDLAGLGLAESWPGLPDYMRGRKATGAKVDPWLIAQELPFGLPDEWNAAALADLLRGQNALFLLLDTPTRRTLDPDEAGPCEVAQCGLSLVTPDDLATALRGVDPGPISLICFAGASALPMLGLLVEASVKLGLDPAAWQGAMAADPVTEFARDGKLGTSLEQCWKEMAATIRWAEEVGSPLRLAGIQAGLWADSGAHAVQELAFGLATGVETLRNLTANGLTIDQAARRCLFSFSLGAEIFPQIAKLRAARLLWHRVVSAAGGTENAMFIHGRSSIFNKSRLDPHTNMLRATAEAFVAAVGGVDSFHVAGFDEPLRTPDTFSRRIARNVHIILGEECNLADLADPAGGSYYIETLTRQFAEAAWKEFQEIESHGGMASAIRQGLPQVAAARSAEVRLGAAASRRDGYIGVNLFPNVLEELLPSPASNQKALQEQRSAQAAAQRAAYSKTELDLSVSAAAEALAAGATIGQVAAALRSKTTPESDVQRLRVRRASEDFEELRLKALAYKEDHGHLPKIWLANFGAPKQYKARADFSAGFISPGGFLTEQGPGAQSVEDAVEAAAKAVDQGALAVVLCSTDDTYPEIVPAFVPLFRARCPQTRLILAGYPTDHVKDFEAAGIQDFLHLRRNCLEFNQQLQEVLGLA